MKNLSVTELLAAFLTGIRFDLASLAATVGLFLLGLIWLQRIKVLRLFWFFFFFVVNSLFILLNFADSELVNFTGRRFSRTSFFLIGEGSVGNLIFPYLGMFLFTILFIGFYFFATVHLTKKIQFRLSVLKSLGASFLILVLSVIAFRGGLQLKPMTTVEGRLFADAMANQLVLNSTFTLLKSVKQSSLERLHFFEKKEMLSLLNPQNLMSTYSGNLEKVNVVIVILESFSKEYTELRSPEFSPYLNQLARGGVSFPQAYANARRSIEGIGSVLAGIPAMMEEPFINSEFSSNEFIGLGHVLAKKGYHSSFFHGARNGSMHFDAFSKSLGIHNYFGQNEYPRKEDHDGTWGIYDGPFLSWACEQISTFPQPFMSSIFTLSSHQPYNVPNDGFHRPEGSHPILKSIHYADSSLQQFMTCAQTKPWFDKTLFIFTADHAGPSLNSRASFKSKFEIPLIFYMKDKSRLSRLDPSQYAQHIDILPTLLETLSTERKGINYLARSLWQPGPKTVTLYADGIYELVGDVKDGEKQLKAVRQYFSEGLFDNRLYYPVGSGSQ